MPEYDETGEPVNLEAAAVDAMEWLQVLHRWLDRGEVYIADKEENVRRLSDAIAAIQRFVNPVSRS